MPCYEIYNGTEDPREWIQGLHRPDVQEKMTGTLLAFAWEHLAPRVQACLNALQKLLSEKNSHDWPWNFERLAAALTEIHEQIREHTSAEHVAQNVMMGVAKTAAVMSTVAIAGPLAATAGLALVGFGTAGVIGGSIAAGIQSIFYGGAVASGSIFAFCQSLAMGGAAAAATVSGVGAAVGGTASIVEEFVRKRPSTTWDDGDNFTFTEELLEKVNRIG